MPGKALVTGATGFLGIHLARHLLEEGWEVRGTDSPSAAFGNLPQGASWIPSDPALPGSLSEAVAGMDVVFHGAALSSGGTPWERLYRTNVLGTENLLIAARRAGVRRVVVFSSFAVYGLAGSGRSEIDETGRIKPRSPYARSRAIQDALVWRYHEDGLPATILRPGLPCGGGGYHALGHLVGLLGRLPAVPIPVNLKTRVLSIHVQDLVRAASFVTARDECAGHEYHIVDESCLTTGRFLVLLAFGLGKKTVPFPMPLGMLKAFALLAGSGSQTGGRLARAFPFLQPETFCCMASRSCASSRKIRSLGFSLLHPDPVQVLPLLVHELAKGSAP